MVGDRVASTARPFLRFRRGQILVIALLYGEESEWLRNLRAGDGGHVIRRGRTFVVGAPQVVAKSEAGSLLARLSAPERAYCQLAEKLAILDVGAQLPGFGRRRESPT